LREVSIYRGIVLFITFNGAQRDMGCTRSAYGSKCASLRFNGCCRVIFVINVASVEFISNSHIERKVDHFTLQVRPILARYLDEMTGRESSIGTATDYGPDGRGFDSR
jgi:hypothetical protein